MGSPASANIDRFGDETLRVVCCTLGAEWGSFYRIGSGQRPFGFRNLGIPREFGAAYARLGMQHVDPLHPFRLVPRKRRFSTMGDARGEDPARHRNFMAFLQSFGGREAAEMIFTHQGKAVAGASLVWTQKAPEYARTVELGTTLQSYIEFSLGALWPGVGAEGRACADAELTSRERDVVDIVCRGFTNEQIASHLNISVATVKTHLIHIFKKARVETRGELISRVLCASKSGTEPSQPSG